MSEDQATESGQLIINQLKNRIQSNAKQVRVQSSSQAPNQVAGFGKPFR